jgi:hypothetical protein
MPKIYSSTSRLLRETAQAPLGDFSNIAPTILTREASANGICQSAKEVIEVFELSRKCL